MGAQPLGACGHRVNQTNDKPEPGTKNPGTVCSGTGNKEMQ